MKNKTHEEMHKHAYKIQQKLINTNTLLTSLPTVLGSWLSKLASHLGVVGKSSKMFVFIVHEIYTILPGLVWLSALKTMNWS